VYEKRKQLLEFMTWMIDSASPFARPNYDAIIDEIISEGARELPRIRAIVGWKKTHVPQ
jgi:hypothetical protein